MITTLTKRIGSKVFGRARSGLRSVVLRTLRGVPAFPVERCESYDEYLGYLERTQTVDRERAANELGLIPENEQHGFRVAGYCESCRRWTDFYVDFAYSYESEGTKRIPNWRETLLCGDCGLNNRMRASLQLFRDEIRPAPNAAVYMTEQVTPLFRRVSRLYPNTIGSEFLADGTEPGSTNSAGVRHEDLTRLSFASGQFDYVLTFEVLEHVPDYARALEECARVLKPGGTIIVTVPFHGKATTTIRARVGPNGIEHILPPEYHGDPLSSDGCLCFYHFGGDFLDALTAAGFSNSTMCVTYSIPLGYLLRRHIFFVATK